MDQCTDESIPKETSFPFQTIPIQRPKLSRRPTRKLRAHELDRKPMTKWFHSLKVSQKLMLVSVLFMVPDSVMLYLFITGINENINFGRLEQQGNQYQRPLERLLELIPQHRMLARNPAEDGAPSASRPSRPRSTPPSMISSRSTPRSATSSNSPPTASPSAIAAAAAPRPSRASGNSSKLRCPSWAPKPPIADTCRSSPTSAL